jgi:hypothetical protein
MLADMSFLLHLSEQLYDFVVAAEEVSNVRLQWATAHI